jgi:hypothetical protein
MRGNFSTVLAAAGASLGAVVCAEPPAATRAGKSRPRSLREYFIGNLLPTGLVGSKVV